MTSNAPVFSGYFRLVEPESSGLRFVKRNTLLPDGKTTSVKLILQYYSQALAAWVDVPTVEEEEPL